MAAGWAHCWAQGLGSSACLGGGAQALQLVRMLIAAGCRGGAHGPHNLQEGLIHYLASDPCLSWPD